MFDELLALFNETVDDWEIEVRDQVTQHDHCYTFLIDARCKCQRMKFLELILFLKVEFFLDCICYERLNSLSLRNIKSFTSTSIFEELFSSDIISISFLFMNWSSFLQKVLSVVLKILFFQVFCFSTILKDLNTSFVLKLLTSIFSTIIENELTVSRNLVTSLVLKLLALIFLTVNENEMTNMFIINYTWVSVRSDT